MTTLEVLGHTNLFGRVESVSVARDYVTDLLKEAGYTLLDDALMLVSELVTNSIRHSHSGWRRHGLITVVVATAGNRRSWRASASWKPPKTAGHFGSVPECRTPGDADRRSPVAWSPPGVRLPQLRGGSKDQ